MKLLDRIYAQMNKETNGYSLWVTLLLTSFIRDVSKVTQIYQFFVFHLEGKVVVDAGMCQVLSWSLIFVVASWENL